MASGRRYLAVAVASCAVGAVALVTGEPAGSAAPPDPVDDRPNIVVVMTDDQTLEQMVALPQTQALLGDPGVTFTNAVVSYPLCCPSRATFLTGQYTQNNGVRSNRAVDDLLPLPEAESASTVAPEAWGAFQRDAEQRSIPLALQRSGYHTALLGKYLNGYPRQAPAPPGWSDWRATARPSYWDGTLSFGGRAEELPEGFVTDHYAGIAREMVDAGVASGDPFFLMVNVFNPHGIPAAQGPAYAPRHEDLYPDAVAPRGPSFDEPDRSDKPPWLVERHPPLTEAQQEGIDQRWRAGLRSLASVDEAVAGLVDHLSTIGELEETVLVFTSDNGLFFGEHAIAAGKSLPYEPAVRVPLIIAGPGVDPAQRGTTSDLPVANVDLGATILDLADTAPLAPLDGRSLVPLLAGDAASWEARHPRPVYLMGIGRTELDPGRPTFSGVRTGDGWVYLRWETSPPAVELYDLRTDPHQLENLAGDPSLQVLQARLERQRQLLVRCAGRSCDVPPFGFLDLPGATVPPWFGPARWAEEAGVEVAFPDGTFRPSGRPARGTTIGWLWREAGSPVAAPSAVADVPPSLQSAADWAVEAGVLSAATTDLRPQLVTSRSTWASWLWRRAGRPPGRSAGLPSDVPARHRTRPEVAWLYTDPDGSGPLRAPGGTVPARFLPDTPVTRATAVTWLRRAAAQFD